MEETVIKENENKAAKSEETSPDVEVVEEELAVTAPDEDDFRPMIEIHELVKKFKKQEALKSISLKIREGDAFGFIGPNGAGKTTTIRILSTLIEPTSGWAKIDGINVVDDVDAIKRMIGFMPDYFGVYDGMKVWEYLDFFASAYRKHASEREGLVNDVLEITDLTGKKDTFIETLSKGMKQRLGVAKTLLHDPKVLILDEPASGLDPRARIELKELLKELTRMGKTIFISSHILPELSDLCNTIGIIEAGQLLAYGSVQDFADNIRSTAIRSIKVKTLTEKKLLHKALGKFEKVVGVKDDNGFTLVDFSGNLEEMSFLLEYLVENKLKVIEFTEKSTDLEDIFLKVTKGEVV